MICPLCLILNCVMSLLLLSPLFLLLNVPCFHSCSPKIPNFIKASKEKFSQGIISITLPEKGVIIGTGAGVVAGLGVKLRTVCKAQMLGAVTSVSPVYNDGQLAGLYMGTNQSNIYFSGCSKFAPVPQSFSEFSKIRL